MFGGSPQAYARSGKIMDLAMKTGVPITGPNDPGRAHQEGVVSLPATTSSFSQYPGPGVVPQISPSWGPAPAVQSTHPPS